MIFLIRFLCVMFLCCEIDCGTTILYSESFGSDYNEITVNYWQDSKWKSKSFATHEAATGGLYADYENDVIFYAAKNGGIYRIHLVNEDGSRKISGTGELFYDKSANHVELPYEYSMMVQYMISYDDQEKMLYVFDVTQGLMCQVNTDTMAIMNFRPGILLDPKITRIQINQGRVYAFKLNALLKTTVEVLLAEPLPPSIWTELVNTTAFGECRPF